MLSLIYTITIFGICQLPTILTQIYTGNSTDPKNCTGYQLWDNDLNACVKDCTATPNSQNVFDSSNTNQCLCNVNFIWNSTSNACIRNCQGVLNSNNQLSASDVTKCQCNAGWTWNSASGDCSTSVCSKAELWINSVSACARDCSNEPNSQLTYDSANINQCVCNDGLYWSTASNLCQVNCTGMAFSNGQVSSDPTQCQCNTNFEWSTSASICARKCTDVNNSQKIPNLLATKSDQCICNYGFSWSSKSL